METAQQTSKRYAALERKRRAAMAYLKAMGYDGDFDTAVHGWLAGQPADTMSIYKPIHQNGKVNQHGAIQAIFDEIDNIEIGDNKAIARAVQTANRIYRGRTINQGDDPEFDKTHAYGDDGIGKDLLEKTPYKDDEIWAERAYSGSGPGGRKLTDKELAFSEQMANKYMKQPRVPK